MFLFIKYISIIFKFPPPFWLSFIRIYSYSGHIIQPFMVFCIDKISRLENDMFCFRVNFLTISNFRASSSELRWLFVTPRTKQGKIYNAKIIW